MIKEILAVVKVLIDSAKGFNKHASAMEKRNDNLKLLKIYFLLKDVQEDGCKLLDLFSPYSVEFMSNEAVEKRLATWDAVLRRQGTRLQEIQSFISKRADLSIMNPKGRKRIAVIVGSKRSRVLSLFNLGAGLFFRTVLPIQESPESLKDLVMRTLTLENDHVLDFAKIQAELSELEGALEEYREIILLFMSNEDVRVLSEKARRETQIHQ